MTDYCNISKAKRFTKILYKLKNKFGVELVRGGKHIKVTCIETNESYPIPCSHNIVNVHIIKDFVRWLEKNDVCTKEQFDQLI